jgi:hypothetical protein
MHQCFALWRHVGEIREQKQGTLAIASSERHPRSNVMSCSQTASFKLFL